MTAQEYLNQIKLYEEFIASNERQIEKLNNEAIGLLGKDFGERVQSSKSNNRLDSILMEIKELITKIEIETEEYYTKKNEIWDVIKKVKNNEQRLVLRLRYIEGLKYKDISEKMHRAERGIYNIHEKALENVVVPESLQ